MVIGPCGSGEGGGENAVAQERVLFSPAWAKPGLGTGRRGCGRPFDHKDAAALDLALWHRTLAPMGRVGPHYCGRGPHLDWMAIVVSVSRCGLETLRKDGMTCGCKWSRFRAWWAKFCK